MGAPLYLKYLNKELSFNEDIFITARFESGCPQCWNQRLVGFNTKLQTLSPTRFLDAELFFCPDCESIIMPKMFYLKHKKEISPLYVINITGDPHNNYRSGKKKTSIDLEKQKGPLSSEEKERWKISSAVYLIKIEYSDHEEKQFTIVTDKKEHDPGKRVFHYSKDPAKELLTAAKYLKRQRKGIIGKRPFIVKEVVTSPAFNEKENPLLVHRLIIKPNGGYKSSVDENPKRFKLADILLYAPFTKQYEVLRVTYDSWEKYCFVSKGNFKDFLDKYGKPEADIGLKSPKFFNKNLGELRDESLLMSYGYSAAKDGPTDRKRQEILTELVDLGIMSRDRITSFLDFLLSLHQGPNFYDAREKWKKDRAFIINYKINPERFLIADFDK